MRIQKYSLAAYGSQAWCHERETWIYIYIYTILHSIKYYIIYVRELPLTVQSNLWSSSLRDTQLMIHCSAFSTPEESQIYSKVKVCLCAEATPSHSLLFSVWSFCSANIKRNTDMQSGQRQRQRVVLEQKHRHTLTHTYTHTKMRTQHKKWVSHRCFCMSLCQRDSRWGC